AMGLTADELEALPAPSDALPDPEAAPPVSVSLKAIKYYASQALERRADYLASRKREESSEALLAAARNRLRPLVDLSVTTGYTGLTEATRFDKYFNSLFANVQGINAVASLRYSFPIENSFAIGQLAQARASRAQTDLRTLELARGIASSVAVAAAGLPSS